MFKYNKTKSTRISPISVGARVRPIRSRPQLHGILRRCHIECAVRQLPSRSVDSGDRAQRPPGKVEAGHPREHLRQLEQLVVVERIIRADLHRPDVVTAENVVRVAALESPSVEDDRAEIWQGFEVLQQSVVDLVLWD